MVTRFSLLTQRYISYRMKTMKFSFLTSLQYILVFFIYLLQQSNIKFEILLETFFQ